MSIIMDKLYSKLWESYSLFREDDGYVHQTTPIRNSGHASIQAILLGSSSSTRLIPPLLRQIPSAEHVDDNLPDRTIELTNVAP
jgi:hypothetical protein